MSGEQGFASFHLISITYLHSQKLIIAIDILFNSSLRSFCIYSSSVGGMLFQYLAQSCHISPAQAFCSCVFTSTHPFLITFTCKVDFGLPYHKTLLSCFPSPVVATLDHSPSCTQPCASVFKICTSSYFLYSSFSTCKMPFCPLCSSYCCDATSSSSSISVIANCSHSCSDSRMDALTCFSW